MSRDQRAVPQTRISHNLFKRRVAAYEEAHGPIDAEETNEAMLLAGRSFFRRGKNVAPLASAIYKEKIQRDPERLPEVERQTLSYWKQGIKAKEAVGLAGLPLDRVYAYRKRAIQRLMDGFHA